MNHKECLNCELDVTGNYCHNCGQKTNTHPITIKHFLFHDIIHGVLHLEKGILLTIKETFTRPGQAALDYIKGKRVKYYNVFYLILMLIGLNILTVHYYHTIEPYVNNNVGDGLKFMNFLSDNVKLILLGLVPLLAFNAFLIFRRLKLNLAEHFIIGGINLLGTLVICLFFNVLSILGEFKVIEYIAGILKFIFFFLIVLFPIWTYFNATRRKYSILGFLWRITVFYAFTLIEIIIFLSFIMYFLTNQTSFNLNLG